MQKILHGKTARTEILKGINILNDVVKVTLGPKGKNVVMNRLHDKARSTKDGVNVAREVAPDNSLHATGAKIIREAASKTAEQAGDSTTTTTILTAEICNRANDLINSGYSAVKLRKGIEKAKEACTDWIKENARPIGGDIERIKQIATIAANNNEGMGELISFAFSKIGSTGVISLEDNYHDTCEIEVMPGYTFERGMTNPFFVTDETKGNCEMIEPYILFYDKKITKVADLKAVLQFIMLSQKPLLIICSGIEGEALGTVLTNKIKKILQVCVVTAPEQGMKRLDLMTDMAIFTGGEMISEDSGTNLEAANFKSEFLGTSEKAIITKERTTIVFGNGDIEKIKIRQAQIKEQLIEAKGEYEKECLRSRAGAMGQGCAFLKIGASTEIERGDIKDLAEDAILAVRSAIEEGYLPGGGLGMIRCAQSLINKDCSAGELLVYNALFTPLKQILENNGHKHLSIGQAIANKLYKKNYLESINSIVKQVLKGSYDYGYNAKTELFSNLVEDGVIDAAKVVRCAIENAASVGQMFLSTEVLISE